MKRLLRFAALLYPARWRRRYRDEFDALLDDVTPAARDVLDVARGAIVARIRMASPVVVAVALAAAGLVAALTIACLTSHRVESTATMTFYSAAGTDGDARLDSALLRLAEHALDDEFLASLGPRHDDQLAGSAPPGTGGESLDMVKRGVVIRLTAPTTLEVSYVSDDAGRSQNMARTLSSHIVEVAPEERASGSIPASTLFTSAPSSPYRSVSHQRVLTASVVGIGSGAMLGMLLATGRLNRAFRAR